MLRVQIYARDVSISLVEPNSTSILNILPAVISQLTEESDSQAVVQLRVGQQLLLAHITSKSLVLLRLKVGISVFVQIKGTSILS